MTRARKSGRGHLILLIAGMALFFANAQSYGCSVCFGDPNNPQSHALNQAILVLLGVMILVLAAVIVFAVRVAYRSQVLAMTNGVESLGSASNQFESSI
jgi:hypothetical protein